MPKSAFRTISRDHHSPMESSERAAGHRSSLNDLRRMLGLTLPPKKSSCIIIPDSTSNIVVALCNCLARHLLPKGVTTMGRLTDKNILITGGNSGIGLAAAQEFDREGARVAICGLNEGSL